ncbi:MAG: YraN family protein [bacterium]|nr:YraN family protein [bacterium]MDD5353967.1 YraN family protein [bacterium]MDD5756060.1 YraN family protein [bacterium]
MSKVDNRRKGFAGEEKAADYLRELGYTIIEQNWCCTMGELDIVALDREALVFIEVKSRRETSYGLPQQAVNGYKQRQIIKAALGYIKSKGITDKDVRFDVVSVNGEDIELIENAFQSDGRYRY